MNITATITQTQIELILTYYFEAITGKAANGSVRFLPNGGASLELGKDLVPAEELHEAIRSAFPWRDPKAESIF